MDDDEDDRFFICRALRHQHPHAEICLFTNREDLLKALAEDNLRPRLIILDVNMPRMNGLEALSQIRSIATNTHLPIVMISTSTSEQDRQRALRQGANDYITKPYSLDQLDQIVGQVKQQWLS